MEKFSVVIITFNEEKNIKRCLESIRDVADEIVVVDSLSTDSTKLICSDYGARFVSQKWLGYSEQKNFANELASFDWIFSIDADEVLSDTLKKSILEIKQQPHLSEDKVFSMNRLTNYCGKWIRHCGWYPDRKTRIWNKKIGKWEGSIHETLNFSEEVTSINLKGDLLHYSFSSKEDYENQMFHFAELRGKAYHEKGKKHAAFFFLFSPIFCFIQHYIFQLGFLDGYFGLQICHVSAMATRYKYLILKQLNNK